MLSNLQSYLSHFKGNFFYDTFILFLGLTILATVSLGVVSLIITILGKELGAVSLIALALSFVFNLCKRIP